MADRTRLNRLEGTKQSYEKLLSNIPELSSNINQAKSSIVDAKNISEYFTIDDSTPENGAILKVSTKIDETETVIQALEAEAKSGLEQIKREIADEEARIAFEEEQERIMAESLYRTDNR